MHNILFNNTNIEPFQSGVIGSNNRSSYKSPLRWGWSTWSWSVRQIWGRKSMVVVLKRKYRKECTLGKLLVTDEKGLENQVATLELPWKENKTNVSCIPEGTYKVVKTYSPRFKKKLWLVKGVPGRSGIRFHPANFVRQLQGCIAPGLTHYDIDGDGIIDITNSRKGMALLNAVLPDKFELRIES